MLRNLLSSRWFQGGLIFFLLCVGGSLLYSWHVLRTTESDMERHDRFSQGLEKQNEPRPAETVNVPTQNGTLGLVDTPAENTDALVPEATEALPNEDDGFADAFLPDGFVSEEAPAEDVPVSPFGFGPYPEVPEDYPHGVSWINPAEKLLRPERREHRKRLELIDRVMVKAWTDGDHNFVGATGNGSGDGKVYLTYPNVIYVEYGKPDENDDGVLIRPIKDALSASYTFAPGEMRNGVIPPNFTVIEYDEAGYDPYTYLDLPSGTN